MIKNKSLDLYEAVITYDAENNPIKTWLFVHAVTYAGVLVTDIYPVLDGGVQNRQGNFQPKSLTEQEITAWGISGRAADAKLFLCDNDPDLIRGRRLYDGDVKYDIVAVNVWPSHTEVILVPVQGGGG